jgi:hypothetical protein
MVSSAAWAQAIHGDPNEANALANELETLDVGLQQPALTTGANWIRGLVFARLGLPSEAREAFSLVTVSNMPMALGPSLERMALELDRVTNNTASARARVERARALGALNVVKVASRYFPELESQPAKPTSPEMHSTVRLEVLGKTQVMVNGLVLSDRTRKGKALLSRLLQARLAGRRELSNVELVDQMYPEMSDEKGASALKQLVYRLRSQLGANAILRTANGYTWSGGVRCRRIPGDGQNTTLDRFTPRRPQ